MLGGKLREARMKSQLMQIEAAQKIGISNVTLSQYEKGIRNPDPNTLSKLADLYKVSADWLLGRFESTRKGFGRDHGENAKATKKYINLQWINKLEDLPEKIGNELSPPVLFYHVLQSRNDIPVTISQSYLPNSLPLTELEDILNGVKEEPTLSLYKTLESFGKKPINCEEILIVDNPTDKEISLLQMPKNVPVARITRKTFDESNNLVEYCHLTSRGDLYTFVNRFSL